MSPAGETQDRRTGSGLGSRQARSAIAVAAVLWLRACGPLPDSVGTSGPEWTPTPVAPVSPIAPATPEETPPGPAGPLAIGPLPSDEIGRYDLLELDVQTDIQVANPFDPEELDIRVEFTSPSGEKSEIGAFWYREYQRPGILGRGPPSWKARFTPTEVGSWTAVARVPARGLESEPVRFRVTPSDKLGFVRVNPDDPRYLAFDDGSFFFPIGQNMGWWTGAGDAISDYTKWMDPFAANGGNAIRVWMAEWSFGIEWNDTGLGDYSNRLGKAWLLDEIFRMAEERGVYVVLVLLNCADYNNWQTNGWNGNPYNAARGGPLARPQAIVTDPEARAYFQRRLNYIVNRWGYSPNLLAWEWWNEVNLAGIPDEALIPWLQEMTAYLRERDVNRHLTTNSYAILDLSPIWQLPELDIIQKHEYASQVSALNLDLGDRAAPDLRLLAESAPPKPILLGEFGYGGEDYGDTVADKTGIHLHNGIWATTFAGYAGSGMYWFWDIYVEPYRLWYHFRGLERFLEGEDLAGYQTFSPLQITRAQGEPGPAVGLGLRGEKVLVWLRSDAYTVQASLDAQQRGKATPLAYIPPLVRGLTLTLEDMQGDYIVQWYDPHGGRWLEELTVTVQGGALSIPIPEFRRDLAAKIVRAPWGPGSFRGPPDGRSAWLHQ
jgi:hypothetical protein